MSSAPRLLPLTDAEWPIELEDMLGGFAGGLNVYRTMAHHPALLRAWSNLREHVVNCSSLPRDGLEVVILRTGLRLESPYEWAQHVDRARRLGLSDDRIRSVRVKAPDMDTPDGLLCAAVDELFEASRLSAETHARLEEAFGRKAIFDLLATVGFYSTLGFLLNTFQTPLDGDIRARLEAQPLDD